MPKPIPLHIVKAYSTEKGVPICLHENKFFRMMFNGYYHYLDAVRYGAGVVMVPRFSNGDFLVVRLRRAPSIGSSIEFPRGGVDAGEALDHAAVRELSEETGYTLTASCATYLGKVAPDTATINGCSDVYLVDIPDSAMQGGFDTEEIEAPFRVTHEKFQDMVRSGEIVDAMTLAAYAMASVIN